MAEERIGVYVCNCGTNIAKMVDVKAVAEFALTIPGVTVASAYKYMCSNPGQEMIVSDIHEHGLTRVVVASCSPRMHEGTFRGAIKRAGLNPYMLEMANIREQCSWIHEDPVASTEKAKALVHAAVERVKFDECLDSRTAPMCASTMVIGGGVTGMSSALELADAGQQVFLVEKQDHLGGNVARLSLTAPYLDSAQDVMNAWISRVEHHPFIRLFLNTELIELKGFNGNFTPKIKTEDGEELVVDAGSILVCTGFKEFDASKVAQYGYGKLPDVITSFELEAMLKRGKIATKYGKTPRNVSIIHCVGSRSEEFHPYCSRVCCTAGLKYAFEIKSALPEAHVTNLYTDMEAFGKGCEDFYLRAGAAGTTFMMYSKHQLPNDPDSCRRGRLQHADLVQGTALGRRDRDADRPGGSDGEHGTARGRREDGSPGQHQRRRERMVHRESPQAGPGGNDDRRRLYCGRLSVPEGYPGIGDPGPRSRGPYSGQGGTGTDHG